MTIESLTQQLAGEILTPDMSDYSQYAAGPSHIGTPKYIVRCANEHDISLSILFAKAHKLPISIRSGGHNLFNDSINNSGIIIELSKMDAIHVIDEHKQLVTVQPGATWGRVAQALQPYKLAITSGDTPSVGVGGLATGGGFGWMVRKYGITIDRIESMQVVLANGSIVTASATENPDLFWALRGGGGFTGIVSQFTFRAHPGGSILHGQAVYPFVQLEGVLRHLQQSIALLSQNITPILRISPEKRLIVLAFVATNQDESTIQAIQKLTNDSITPNEQKLQKTTYGDLLPDHGHSLMSGTSKMHGATVMLKTLSDDVIATILESADKNELPALQIRFIDGPLNSIKPQDTAFAFRNAQVLCQLFTESPGPVAAEYLDACKSNLESASLGDHRNLSFQDDPKAAFAQNLKKLQEVKATYDPEGVLPAINLH